MKNFINEFKSFAIRGNVIDLAVGVIIGGAFGQIVNSLVKDIIMPPLGYILGGVDFSDKKIILKEAVGSMPEVAFNYGLFINAIVSFIIISFAIFFIIRQINKLKKAEEKVADATPSEEILLLREIRDSLKK